MVGAVTVAEERRVYEDIVIFLFSYFLITNVNVRAELSSLTIMLEHASLSLLSWSLLVF